MTDAATKRVRFRALHQNFFVLPNAANAGEAKRLAELGFKAVASTSHGLALQLGKRDLSATVDDTLRNLNDLVAATDLPVNADFEAGFANDAKGVAENVRRAASTGIAGLSIEDRKGEALYELLDAVERLHAARAALDAIDPSIVLVGRTEGFLIGNTDIAATVERVKLFAAAGADVLYVPGVASDQHITAIVEAAAPKPVNVLLVTPQMTTAHLKSLGVCRVSVGGFLGTAAWTAFDEAAKALVQTGSLPAHCFG